MWARPAQPLLLVRSWISIPRRPWGSRPPRAPAGAGARSRWPGSAAGASACPPARSWGCRSCSSFWGLQLSCGVGVGPVRGLGGAPAAQGGLRVSGALSTCLGALPPWSFPNLLRPSRSGVRGPGSGWYLCRVLPPPGARGQSRGESAWPLNTG